MTRPRQRFESRRVSWLAKVMLGTRSADGERAVERLLTIVRTYQLQQLNALVYLTVASPHTRARQAAPSLLSGRQTMNC
jgi:hypothetical protein